MYSSSGSSSCCPRGRCLRPWLAFGAIRLACHQTLVCGRTRCLHAWCCLWRALPSCLLRPGIFTPRGRYLQLRVCCLCCGVALACTLGGAAVPGLCAASLPAAAGAAPSLELHRRQQIQPCQLAAAQGAGAVAWQFTGRQPGALLPEGLGQAVHVELGAAAAGQRVAGDALLALAAVALRSGPALAGANLCVSQTVRIQVLNCSPSFKLDAWRCIDNFILQKCSQTVVKDKGQAKQVIAS